MKSQNLGDLASDQKIENIFHAFGYSIPVGKDGRRLWPTKFKREMGRRMRSGKLSVDEVQRTCQISDKTAYKWRKGGARKSSQPPSKPQNPVPAFAEVRVQCDDEHIVEPTPLQIVFKRGESEVLLPLNYPIDQLALLIRALEAGP